MFDKYQDKVKLPESENLPRLPYLQRFVDTKLEVDVLGIRASKLTAVPFVDRFVALYTATAPVSPPEEVE